MKSPYARDAGAVVAINVQLLFAFGFAVSAWAIWPQSAEWWGLGVLSVLLGLGALSGLGSALRSMAALHAKRREIAVYLAQGEAPKSARMTSTDQLRQKGMIP